MKPERRQAAKGSRPRRQIYYRETAQTFLIVCEGQKTEKLYFEAFKVPKDVRGIDVVGTGKNTVSLVKEAIRLKERKDYDQVWCVFDVEDYTPQAIHRAVQLAGKHGIQIACSNQAFELWYLLHFSYFHTATDRQHYIERLTQDLGFPYEKNYCPYANLIEKQATAISHAQRLLQEYDRYDPANSDPSTTVHLLVQELNRFSPEGRAHEKA